MCAIGGGGKKKLILEHLTRDLLKNTAFQKAGECALKVVIQAEHWKMQVSSPELLKHTWKEYGVLLENTAL